MTIHRGCKDSQGSHRVVIVCLKVVIRLSWGCHNGSRWIVIGLSVKQKSHLFIYAAWGSIVVSQTVF